MKIFFTTSAVICRHINRSKELQRRNYVEPVAIRYALDGTLG